MGRVRSSDGFGKLRRSSFAPRAADEVGRTSPGTLDGFTRKIEIVELSGFLRQITVTITYPATGQTKTYAVTALISQYA